MKICKYEPAKIVAGETPEYLDTDSIRFEFEDGIHYIIDIKPTGIRISKNNTGLIIQTIASNVINIVNS